MGYYEGEISGLGCNNNNGMGSGWEGLIGLVLVAGLLGNGNFGGLFGGGRNGNAGADFAGWQLGRLATTNDVASGFSTSEIMSDLNSIINSLTQGFAGINTVVSNATSTLGYNMAQGFHGVDNAVCNLGFNIQNGFNTLGHQISDCCCAQARNIDSLRFDVSRGFCDVIQASNNNTRAILDYLTNEKIEGLRAENTSLKGQISNDRQSAYIIDALAPKCPQPAYVVQPPQQVTFPTNCCGNAAFANYGAGYGACGASVQ